MFTVLLLCLVGIVAAQQPRPCTTPAQWESRIFDTNERQHITAQGQISYDSVYHRIRVLENVEAPGIELGFDVIALYDAKIEFVYDIKNNSCTRRAITEPWSDYGILPDARSYGEAYIGSSASATTGLHITIWGGNVTLPTNETVPYMGTWTYDGCLPISRITYSENSGNEVLSFYDVISGISNPNVFIPRAECLTEKENAMRDVLFGTPTKKN